MVLENKNNCNLKTADFLSTSVLFFKQNLWFHKKCQVLFKNISKE